MQKSLNKLYRQGVVNREDDAFRKIKDATVKMVSLCDDVDINDYKLTPKQQKVAEQKQKISKLSEQLSEAEQKEKALQDKKFVEMYNKYKLDITPEIMRNYFGQSIKKAETDKLIFEYKKWAE